MNVWWQRYCCCLPHIDTSEWMCTYFATQDLLPFCSIGFIKLVRPPIVFFSDCGHGWNCNGIWERSDGCRPQINGANGKDGINGTNGTNGEWRRGSRGCSPTKLCYKPLSKGNFRFRLQSSHMFTIHAHHHTFKNQISKLFRKKVGHKWRLWLHHSSRIVDSETWGPQGQSVIGGTADGQPIGVGTISIFKALWSTLLVLSSLNMPPIPNYIQLFFYCRPREWKV